MIFYEEILRDLQQHQVKYILVGGVAANLLGAMRTTADLDILVEMSDDNLKKIVRIMKSRGFRVKQPVDPMGIADRKTREDWIQNKHMKAFNFYKEDDLQEVDIIIESPVTFEEAQKSSEMVKVDDLILPVISVDKLIKMKMNTGRSIDKSDIAELKMIKELRKKS